MNKIDIYKMIYSYNNKEEYAPFLNNIFINKEQNEYNIEEDVISIDNKDFSINPILALNLEKATKAYTNDEKIVNKKFKKKSLNEFQNNNLPEKLNKMKKEATIKKKCGRKRERNNEEEIYNEHNKYSDDNMRRKCKHLVLKYTKEFINDKIQIIYDDNIGKGLFKKELQTINQSQKFNATINFNKNFLKKTLGEIFSENISGRFTNYPMDHNKLLIKKLLNDKDENKKAYFQKLFNITFLECLMHFIGEKYINELIGLKCFNDIKNNIKEKYEDGEEYISQLEYYFKNYEKIINKKKSRNRKKKGEDNNKKTKTKNK